MVRLAAGLDPETRCLDEATQARALETLARFGQRLRGLPREAVRVVGTNTLRSAKNAGAFIARAEAVLGHEIEIVSGREEARLIYLGVAACLSGDERRLVVDIGGGSTEVIVGQGLQPIERESLHMGCVSWTRAHFPEGRLGKGAWQRAVLCGAGGAYPVGTGGGRLSAFGVGTGGGRLGHGAGGGPGERSPGRGRRHPHRRGFGKGGRRRPRGGTHRMPAPPRSGCPAGAGVSRRPCGPRRLVPGFGHRADGRVRWRPAGRPAVRSDVWGAI